MKPHLTLALLLLLLSFQAHSQRKKIDSLRQVVKHSDDPSSLFELAKLLQNNNNDSCYLLYTKALSSVTDGVLKARILGGISSFHLTKEFYSMAQKAAFDALENALPSNDSVLISQCYFRLGTIATNTDVHEKAVSYLEQAMKYSPNSSARNNLGIEYLNSGSFFKAMNLFQDALSGSKKDDSIGIAIIHNNLGDAFLKLQNYDSAYKHIKATLTLSTLTKDSIGLMFDNLLMGRFYAAQHNFKKAKTHLYAAFALDKKFGAGEQSWNVLERSNLYKQFVDIYKEEKNVDSVSFFKDQLIELYQATLTKQQRTTSEFVFSDQEDQLKAIVEKQKRQRSTLTEYYAIALGLLVGIVLYFLFTGKDRQRKYAPMISMIMVILTFEFLLIVLDPVTAKITHGDQLYGFLINVLLALLLIPAQNIGQRIFKKFAVDIRLRRMEQE